MWDLETLDYLNARYVKEERERKKNRPATPVEILAEKLLAVAPPSIPTLVAVLTEQEDFADFRELVRTFIPEHEGDILREKTPQAQIASFATHFEDQYFPIGGKFIEFENYSELLQRIPCEIRGISYEDYDQIGQYWDPPYVLMAYMVKSPYDEEGERIGLAESCMEIVPKELVERVPAKGLPPTIIHTLLDGTRFEGLAIMADYIHQNTGNFFLDTDDEMFYSGEGPEWTMEEVKAATQDWLEADALDAKINKLGEWLKEDLAGHFKELLDFIDERGRTIGGSIDQRNTPAGEGAPALTVGAPGVASGTAG